MDVFYMHLKVLRLINHYKSDKTKRKQTEQRTQLLTQDKSTITIDVQARSVSAITL